MENKRVAITLVVLVVAVCLVANLCLATVAVGWRVASQPTPTVEGIPTATSAVQPQATPTFQPLPTLEATLTPTETLKTLEETEVPPRDMISLAQRLKGVKEPIPLVVKESPPSYKVGDEETFWASNVDTDEHFRVTATLRYITPHLYMWVEKGVDVNLDDLKRAADLFEEKIYPTDREFFGTEWTPGVDNDPHLHILHARGLGDSVAGYFSGPDEFSHLVHQYSNEREMFYINVENVTVGDDFYNGVLAHEFQHMIHWYNDRNEDTWLNEGFSELAAYLNGLDVGGSYIAYAMQPDTQLNSWPDEPGEAGPNYGGAYLFTSYFLERFGEEATRALVANKENGIVSVNDVLAELGTGYTFEDLLADWVIANYLDDPAAGDGRYDYEALTMRIVVEESVFDYPAQAQAEVHQYAADYIVLERADVPVKIEFQGATLVKVVDNEAHSGTYQWWSNRGDDSDMTLTRAFDLGEVEKATLSYWAWYDIEEDWDYAYLEVSADGGETWKTLPATSTTDTNPNGNNYGWGYTGQSGGGSPQWIEEEVDLSDYAGQEILLRFEYITDDAVNRPGFCVDDMAIPEIGYQYDAEKGDDGWAAEGFIRMDNILPQEWIVQVIELGAETAVKRMALDEGQRGEYVIEGFGRGVNRAVLVISALAPATSEAGIYRYAIAPVE